jgi:hypothetical protein
MKPTIDQQVLQRIRGEFLEMPGMALRLEQVRRLCGVETPVCQTVLDALVAAGFLRMTPDGRYLRWTTDDSIDWRAMEGEAPRAAIRATRRSG